MKPWMQRETSRNIEMMLWYLSSQDHTSSYQKDERDLGTFEQSLTSQPCAIFSHQKQKQQANYDDGGIRDNAPLQLIRMRSTDHGWQRHQRCLKSTRSFAIIQGGASHQSDDA